MTHPPRFAAVLFDWGDTVMRDDPAMAAPMVEWPAVRVVEGIPVVLEYLQHSGRQIILATSADVSDEDQIYAALARGGIHSYFSRVYCFKNTGLPKGAAFYRHLLDDLRLPAAQAVMVGDHFAKDVQAANTAGLFALWFNPHSDENRSGELHRTVHSMQELLRFFQTDPLARANSIPGR